MTVARTLPASERKPRILERHIQDAVVAFLQIDGWRAFRTELTVQRERGRVVGERGQPDYLFIRYCCDPTKPLAKLLNYDRWRTSAEAMWIEFKRPKQKPRPDQVEWHRAERARGALVLVVDSIDEFRKWYLMSGLNRRIAA